MSSVYAPGANQAAAALGVSETVSILGISLFCVGLSLGPMIGSPLSEEFGRLMVYRFSLPIASLFIIGSGAANTAAGVLICRFFAGAFASPALGIGGASVADMFSPSQYGQATSGFLLAPFFGPSLCMY
jgi:MFS family permease